MSTLEYRTTIQPLWRNAQSEHFAHPDGVYNAPTAPLEPPAEPGAPWHLHSVQQFALGGLFGEPKLLVVWARAVRGGDLRGPIPVGPPP